MNYETRIVAFVDILGFKSKIESSVASPLEHEKIHNALTQIYRVKADNDNPGLLNQKGAGVQVSTFSDSAVVSYPAVGDALFYLILELIWLQLDLALADVLLRGGLTIGPLFHDGALVYGPAMNRAYELESVIAKYPRIVVDEPAIVQYIEGVRGDTDHIKDLDKLLNRDADGLWYVNMLMQSQEFNDPGNQYRPWLANLKYIIVQGLKVQDVRVREKYEWLRDKFNALVTDDSQYFPIPEELMHNGYQAYREGYRSLEIGPIEEEGVYL